MPWLIATDGQRGKYQARDTNGLTQFSFKGELQSSNRALHAEGHRFVFDSLASQARKDMEGQGWMPCRAAAIQLTILSRWKNGQTRYIATPNEVTRCWAFSIKQGQKTCGPPNVVGLHFQLTLAGLVISEEWWELQLATSGEHRVGFPWLKFKAVTNIVG